MNSYTVWFLCVPVPLAVLGFWGLVLVARNWRSLRW
jgi:hypothetical protein